MKQYVELMIFFALILKNGKYNFVFKYKNTLIQN